MTTPTNDLQPAPSQKIIRLVRPSIVVLCGPAGCGKSTFAERRFRPTQVISSDWARGRVCDDERDQRFQAQAFALVHFLIGQRLGLNRLCVVDSTALTPQARKELLSLGRKYQVPCFAFLFEVPLEKCVERDAGRERSVGRAVIERQYQLFDQARASLRQEGFDQIYELREDDMDNVQIETVFRPVTRPMAPPARGAGERGRHGPRPVPPSPSAPSPAPGTSLGVRSAAAPSSTPGVVRDLRTVAGIARPTPNLGVSSPPAQATPSTARPAPAPTTAPASSAAAPGQSSGNSQGAAAQPSSPPASSQEQTPEKSES